MIRKHASLKIKMKNLINSKKLYSLKLCGNNGSLFFGKIIFKIGVHDCPLKILYKFCVGFIEYEYKHICISKNFETSESRYVR